MIDFELYDLNKGLLKIINNSSQKAENWVNTDNRLAFSTYGVDYKGLEVGDLVQFQNINLETLKTKIINDLATTNVAVESIEVIGEGRDLTFNIKVIN